MRILKRCADVLYKTSILKQIKAAKLWYNVSLTNNAPHFILYQPKYMLITYNYTFRWYRGNTKFALYTSVVSNAPAWRDQHKYAALPARVLQQAPIRRKQLFELKTKQ